MERKRGEGEGGGKQVRPINGHPVIRRKQWPWSRIDKSSRYLLSRLPRGKDFSSRVGHRVSGRFLSKSAWNAGQGNTIPPFVARRETKTIVSADSRYLKIHFTISGTNGSHS